MAHIVMMMAGLGGASEPIDEKTMLSEMGIEKGLK